MSTIRIATVATLLALAPLPAAADCKADLAANDVRFEQTLKRLESVKKGTKAQKCAAYRSHVRIMEQGRAVFARCNTGTTQRENVGQMNDSIEDFRELIRRNC